MMLEVFLGGKDVFVSILTAVSNWRCHNAAHYC